MKSLFFLLVIVLGWGLSGQAQDQGWPRQMYNEGTTFTYYQPQVENWTNFVTLDFRMAFTLKSANGKTNVGVVDVQSATDVNTSTHMVFIYDMKVTGVHFPGLNPDSTAALVSMVRSFLPDGGNTVSVSLDRIAACTPKTAPSYTAQVKNTPPVIFVSYGPAVMVQVDGEPVYASIENTNLTFIVNTNWPVFQDKTTSVYYLCSNKVWFTATSPGSTWTRITKLPADFTKLDSDPNWAGISNAIPPPKVDSKSIPAVYYSGTPSEIIIFDGAPQFAEIPGTSLQYASNTSSEVFLKLPEAIYYCLFSGRWFSSGNLQGPWSYASNNLPADFANIPYSSPAAAVLSSVPGTEDAADAVLIAQIPTSITVNPVSADSIAKVTYNGTPVFVPIEGTTMNYANNTPDKVIEVNNIYYLCFQGIWFVSISANGPWNVATTVPDVIYTIPSSSPVYNVTFVTQVVTPDGYVTASYTSGYTGVYVTGSGPNVVLVMGSGYYYPPCYIYPPIGYPMYYPCAMTYGYAAYGYHPYCGVSYSSAYYGASGTYARSASAYGPYGKATVGQAYNPYTGTYARGASVSTPYGTSSAAQAYNPKTGAYGQTHQNSSPYGQWGSSTVTDGHGQSATTAHATNAYGSVAAGATSTGGKAVAGSSAYGSGGAVKTSSGNMYAAKDGNVYKNTGSGWEQGGNSQSFSSQAALESQSQDMNKEAQNRQRGAYQSSQFQNSGGWSGGARGSSGGFGGFGSDGGGRFGGGGGFRGGGGRR